MPRPQDHQILREGIRSPLLKISTLGLHGFRDTRIQNHRDLQDHQELLLLMAHQQPHLLAIHLVKAEGEEIEELKAEEVQTKLARYGNHQTNELWNNGSHGSGNSCF